MAYVLLTSPSCDQNDQGNGDTLTESTLEYQIYWIEFKYHTSVSDRAIMHRSNEISISMSNDTSEPISSHSFENILASTEIFSLECTQGDTLRKCELVRVDKSSVIPR